MIKSVIYEIRGNTFRLLHTHHDDELVIRILDCHFLKKLVEPLLELRLIEIAVIVGTRCVADMINLPGAFHLAQLRTSANDHNHLALAIGNGSFKSMSYQRE